MPKTKFIGFSLIELMIVIAIIGILSVIAVPTYQSYTKRARFAEVIAATQPFKIAIAVALQTGADNTALTTGAHGIPNAPAATKNLADIQVKNGIITATGTALVDNKNYILQPDAEGSVWTATGSCVSAGWCDVD